MFQSYNAKISGFGLAIQGTSDSQPHVSTEIIVRDGYAATEYVATGKLGLCTWKFYFS